jgi:tRNA1Val (adenine37-N6)-methyltransferase
VSGLIPATVGGVVRSARRPPGWRAPGPPPVTPADRPELWPRAGEDLCWLAGDWRILQRTDGHRFSLDDLVTAHLAASVCPASLPGARVLDLGCGIGSVLLYLAWRFPQARCLGVEAQELSAGMAMRSVAWNGVEARCQVRLGDFRDPAVLDGTFDLVTGTPPYFPRGAGVESPASQRAHCRFEHRGGVEDYCATAARVLAPGAPFVGCAAASQRARVVDGARAAGLGVERWREVIPRAGKPPLIGLFVLRRGAATAADEPPLVVRDRRGRRTPEFAAMRAALGMPP